MHRTASHPCCRLNFFFHTILAFSADLAVCCCVRSLWMQLSWPWPLPHNYSISPLSSSSAGCTDNEQLTDNTMCSLDSPSAYRLPVITLYVTIILTRVIAQYSYVRELTTRVWHKLSHLLLYSQILEPIINKITDENSILAIGHP